MVKLKLVLEENAPFSKYESIGKREFYPTKWGFLYLLTVHMFSSKVNKHKPKQNQKTFLSILSFLQEFFSGEDQRSIFSQVRLNFRPLLLSRNPKYLLKQKGGFATAMVPRDMHVLKFFDQTLRVLDQILKSKT